MVVLPYRLPRPLPPFPLIPNKYVDSHLWNEALLQFFFSIESRFKRFVLFVVAKETTNNKINLYIWRLVQSAPCETQIRFWREGASVRMRSMLHHACANYTGTPCKTIFPCFFYCCCCFLFVRMRAEVLWWGPKSDSPMEGWSSYLAASPLGWGPLKGSGKTVIRKVESEFEHTNKTSGIFLPEKIRTIPENLIANRATQGLPFGTPFLWETWRQKVSTEQLF